MDTSLYVHDAPKLATFQLAQSLISDEVHFDLGQHMAGARAAGLAVQMTRMGRGSTLTDGGRMCLL